MKKILLAVILSLGACLPAFAQDDRPRPYYIGRLEISGNDSLAVFDIHPPIYVFKRKIDMRRYDRLIRNVKIVYPIAREAERRLRYIEEQMLLIPDPKAQKAFVKQMEKDLKKEYTPILKKMTFSQGKILIKLIDRQTGNTSYELVKELRGGFSAALWQGVAKIFGANLKDTYDGDGDDKVIEDIILMYEAGMI